MLAVEADLTKINYPVLVSPKLDGIRCLIIDGKPMTRNGKPVPNKFVRNYLSSHPWLEGFDGELVLHDETKQFNEITSAIMSREGEPNFVFKVFDRIGGASFESRFESMRYVVNSWHKINVCVVPHYYCNSEEKLLEYEKLFLEAGFEGLMIRDPNGPYKHGRSTQKEGYLLKLKRFKDDEARIVGFIERLHNGNGATINALGYTERSSHKAGKVACGTLGAIVVESPSFSERFEIGTGFTDEDRQTIWDHAEAYTGRVVTFKYQECGTLDRPRFPVFKGFREDL